MKIKTFIQIEILQPRLKQFGVLTVYDPETRYRELCLELASEKIQLIDASQSSISSRTAAMKTLQEFGQPNPPFEGILVYIPARKAETDEQKQRDPFAIYGALGVVFPDGDGDEFQSLCIKARADHATEIRKIFSANPNPSFAVIDAVGGGAGWPNLQTLLKVESARDILFALLAPSDSQKAALAKDPSNWLAEAIGLFQSTLGLDLKTKIKNWSAIADELWRFVMFSELVFDMPGDLPAALNNVPRAPEEARPLVFDLCDRLRNDRRTNTVYIERTETIENEMNLPLICQAITDFGLRDTFPFEERASFAQAVDALKHENVDKLRGVLHRHEQSVWVGRGENQAQWELLTGSSFLLQACEDVDQQLFDHSRSLDALINFYINDVREVDRLQREFEQSAVDHLDSGGSSVEVINQSRAAYRKLMDKVQTAFLRLVEKSGWPASGRLSNTTIFDKIIAPKLQESGRKVAYFMIDALRYELGVELSKHLNEAGQVDVQAACAQMPTITPVGMAGLLPEAGVSLKLLNKNEELCVALGENPLGSVTQRMDILRKRYGQRFAELELSHFVRNNPKIDSPVELLVIRSNDMDNDFEANPEAAPGLISRSFQKIRSAVYKLRELGYQDVVIVTDHGFFLNTALEPGDVCAKPTGKWINVHERCLLGDGNGDLANLIMSAGSLGVSGEFNQVAVPRALVSYRVGQTYFHGGLSLQEAIVPVISVRLRQESAKVGSKLAVKLIYKRGSKKITTHLPVVDIQADADFFAQETEILIEAHDAKGQVIGEAKPGGPVNPATRTITIKPGDTIAVTIKMDLEFEGKFFIKALDPITQAALGQSLELETDYTV